MYWHDLSVDLSHFTSTDPGELLRLYLEKCEVEQSANEEKAGTSTNSRVSHSSHSSSLPLSPPARRGNLSNSNIDSYDPSAPSINFGSMDRTNSFPQMWPKAMYSLQNSAASVSSSTSQTSKPVSITLDTSVMNALNMSSGSSHVPSTLGTQHLGLNNLSNLSYYQQLIQSLYRPTSNLQTPGPRESAPTPPTVAPNQNVSSNISNGQTTSSNAFQTPSMLPFMGLGFNLGMPSLGMNSLPMSMNLPMNVPGMNGMNMAAMGLGVPGMNVMGMPGAPSGIYNPNAFMSNGVGPGQGQNQRKSGNIDVVERS
ncbi:hypothetical protein BKA69DRAFT_835377 [Paraphysoderma sedebokerense]|nr:hypothetical protein BKA69DRAFT_835377 [Paraphysoderma sedebokerense]